MRQRYRKQNCSSCTLEKQGQEKPSRAKRQKEKHIYEVTGLPKNTLSGLEQNVGRGITLVILFDWVNEKFLFYFAELKKQVSNWSWVSVRCFRGLLMKNILWFRQIPDKLS